MNLNRRDWGDPGTSHRRICSQHDFDLTETGQPAKSVSIHSISLIVPSRLRRNMDRSYS
jgi:hypothetical protein